MNRFIVILGALAAVGAGYATKDWPGTQQDRIRGNFRSGGGATAPLATNAPAVPTAPGTPGTPAKPVDPPKAPTVVFTKEILDLVLPKALGAQDIPLGGKDVVELHVNVDADGEPSIAWHGAGKSSNIPGFQTLVRELGKKAGVSVLVAADERATWQWCRFVMASAQEAFLPQVWICAAKPGEPNMLRGFPLSMPTTRDAPMPAVAEQFVVALKGDTLGGPVEVTVNGKPSTDIALTAAIVAAEWAVWSKANAKWADTSTADRTHVVLDVPGMTPLGNVVPTIDAIRAAGIGSMRLGGKIGSRPR